METILKPLAKRIIDLAHIGFDCGFFSNPVGNFSVIPHGEYYLASFRAFGYYITTETQNYVFTTNMVLAHPDEHIFCLLDRDFSFIKRLPIAENTYWKDPKFNKRTPYLEDLRMVEWDGSIYGISSVFYQNETSYERFGMEVQKIAVDGEAVRCSHFWNSIEHGMYGRMKNLMPIPDKPYRYISATYQSGATMIDISNDRITEGGICEGEMYRGNSPLLKTDWGYMTITHRLTADERNRKRYINYIVEYNADLSVRWISRPFKLTESNIEFATALLELPSGEIAIGCTEMDDTPMLMVFDRDEFLDEVII